MRKAILLLCLMLSMSIVLVGCENKKEVVEEDTYTPDINIEELFTSSTSLKEATKDLAKEISKMEHFEKIEENEDLDIDIKEEETIDLEVSEEVKEAVDEEVVEKKIIDDFDLPEIDDITELDDEELLDYLQRKLYDTYIYISERLGGETILEEEVRGEILAEPLFDDVLVQKIIENFDILVDDNKLYAPYNIELKEGNSSKLYIVNYGEINLEFYVDDNSETSGWAYSIVTID